MLPCSRYCILFYQFKGLIVEGTSKLNNDECFLSDWHYCLICRKNSRFQCFCCPNAVCLRCFKDALFAKVKGNKGFCNDCLKLALLEEEGMEVDSDGVRISFYIHNLLGYFLIVIVYTYV